MERIHAIITGTSRGIGESIAAQFLRKGHSVSGIARGTSLVLSNQRSYLHYQFDLTQAAARGDSLMRSILDSIDLRNIDKLVLINNAARVEPLALIDQCSPEDIVAHIALNISAPMLLAAAFIRHTAEVTCRREIINVTSGAGTKPFPGMSAYCSSKAALNMFNQCAALEQASVPNPVRVRVFNPGMVDTDMQRIARGTDDSVFPQSSIFKTAHDQGQLQSAAKVAELFYSQMLETADNNVVTGFTGS